MKEPVDARASWAVIVEYDEYTNNYALFISEQAAREYAGEQILKGYDVLLAEVVSL